MRNGVKEMARSAFEFGYRCAEKGMNLERALMTFDKTMDAPLRKPKKEQHEKIPHTKSR